MKIIKRCIIPIQQCSLCRTIVEIEPKDLMRDAVSLDYAMWKCSLCKEINRVDWGE